MASFKDILKEVTETTLPIAALILALDTILVGASVFQFILELLCCVIVIMGFSLFLMGVEVGIIPMGKAIGQEMARRRSMIGMIVLAFIISMVVTIAEPDVSVFSTTVGKVFPSVDSFALTLSIALGVGIMLVLATLRLALNVSIRLLITIGYGIIVVFGLMVPQSVLGIAFDSGGVTTGPVTIPVLIALGMGVSVAVSRRGSTMDGFGMIGLASIGPLITVMIYGSLTFGGDVGTVQAASENIPVGIESLIEHFVSSVRDTLVSVLPLFVIFLLLQRFYIRGSWKDLWIMTWGIIFTMLGMIMFLTGVYAGFMPLAEELGTYLVESNSGLWILVIGLVLGFLVIVAEPAVKILGTQVESASKGAITNKTITLVVGAGVSVFVGVGMYAMSQGWMSMYYALPIYVVAVIMLWFMEKDLIGITYDAGGVATGPMSVAIIMTMYSAIAQASGPEIAMNNAFGIIAFIALAPIIALSILGVCIHYKKKHVSRKKVKQ